MSDILRIKKGEFLLREGDESKEMYLLSKGRLTVLKGMGEEERKIGTIVPNQLVGELSFLDGAPRSASVLAQEDSELIQIPREKFEEVLNNQQDWFKKIALTLATRLRKANTRIKV